MPKKDFKKYEAEFQVAESSMRMAIAGAALTEKQREEFEENLDQMANLFEHFSESLALVLKGEIKLKW